MDLKFLLIASLLVVAHGVRADDDLQLLEAKRAQVLKQLTEVLGQLLVAEKAEADVSSSHAKLDGLLARAKLEVAAAAPASHVDAALRAENRHAVDHAENPVNDHADNPVNDHADDHTDVGSDALDTSRAAVLDHLAMVLKGLRSEEHAADESAVVEQDVDSDTEVLLAERAKLLNNLHQTIKQLLVANRAGIVDEALVSNKDFTDSELTALLKARDYNDQVTGSAASTASNGQEDATSNAAATGGEVVLKDTAVEPTVAATSAAPTAATPATKTQFRVKDLEDGGKYWKAGRVAYPLTSPPPSSTDEAENAAAPPSEVPATPATKTQFRVKDLEDGGKYWKAGRVAYPLTSPPPSSTDEAENVAAPVPVADKANFKAETFQIKDLEDDGRFWKAASKIYPYNVAKPVAAPAADKASMRDAALAEFFHSLAKSAEAGGQESAQPVVQEQENAAPPRTQPPESVATEETQPQTSFVNMLAAAIMQRLQGTQVTAEEHVQPAQSAAASAAAAAAAAAAASADQGMQVMDADAMQQTENHAEAKDEAAHREQEQTAADDLLADLTW